MDKEEIKDYLKRVYELGGKLTGYDKETYTWLIYGYNQCAKLLNETEQQCKKQKETIDKVRNNLEKDISVIKNVKMSNKEIICRLEETNKMLKEVSE